MIEIPLTKGQMAIVDDEDAHVARLKWQALETRPGRFYAVRSEYHPRRLIYMHRFVLDLPPARTPVVDHWNGNRLDNRRPNLRIATNSQNLANAGSHGGASSYKGVSPTGGRWKAKIQSRVLGIFEDEISAAQAYDEAAREVFGSFARTNF